MWGGGREGGAGGLRTLTCLILAPCRPMMSFTASWGTRISISMSSSPTNVSRSSAEITLDWSDRQRPAPLPALPCRSRRTPIREINRGSQPQGQGEVTSEWALEDPERLEDGHSLWDCFRYASGESIGLCWVQANYFWRRMEATVPGEQARNPHLYTRHFSCPAAGETEPHLAFS